MKCHLDELLSNRDCCMEIHFPFISIVASIPFVTKMSGVSRCNIFTKIWLLSFLSKNYTYIRTWYSFKLSKCCMKRWNKHIVKWYQALWRELSVLQPVSYNVTERHENSCHLKFPFYIFSLLSGSFRENLFYSLICYRQIYLGLQTSLGSYWFWCRTSERHHECTGRLSILGTMSPFYA